MILDALDNLMEGRTSFMIAHRLSTIRDADLIVVLNHGELVEQGTHDDLLGRRGLYYQLYEAQTGRSAKIEAEYAQAQAEGKSAEESAEIAMTAGAIAESEAADALAEATANAADGRAGAGAGAERRARAGRGGGAAGHRRSRRRAGAASPQCRDAAGPSKPPRRRTARAGTTAGREPRT